MDRSKWRPFLNASLSRSVRMPSRSISEAPVAEAPVAMNDADAAASSLSPPLNAQHSMAAKPALTSPRVKESPLRAISRSAGRPLGGESSCSLCSEHWVFILSTGRAGSTSLLEALNALPGVRLAGENQASLEAASALFSRHLEVEDRLLRTTSDVSSATDSSNQQLPPPTSQQPAPHTCHSAHLPLSHLPFRTPAIPPTCHSSHFPQPVRAPPRAGEHCRRLRAH